MEVLKSQLATLMWMRSAITDPLPSTSYSYACFIHLGNPTLLKGIDRLGLESH